MRFALALVSILLTLGVTPAQAATPDGLTVNRHGVVQSNTLPGCDFEDYPTNPPCVWNIPPHGDDGMASWVGVHGARHFVWNRSVVKVLSGHGYRWSVKHPRWLVKQGRYIKPSASW